MTGGWRKLNKRKLCDERDYDNRLKTNALVRARGILARGDKS